MTNNKCFFTHQNDEQCLITIGKDPLITVPQINEEPSICQAPGAGSARAQKWLDQLVQVVARQAFWGVG